MKHSMHSCLLDSVLYGLNDVAQQRCCHSRHVQQLACEGWCGVLHQPCFNDGALMSDLDLPQASSGP